MTPHSTDKAGYPAGISTSEIIEIMKRLIISALCAVAFGACGGSSSNNNDDGPVFTDAGPTFDGGGEVLECNPVTQAGCEAGEKCAQLVESADPFLARTACVPAGAVTEGGACTRGEAGAATGFDDCIGGYDCTNGVCTEICDVGPPDGCRADGEAFGEGSYCTLYEGLFTDAIGVCVAGCNPVDDTVTDGVVNNGSCAAGEGCYLNATRGVAACANTPVDAAEATQNSDCYGPASGGCYLNGCASGFTALLNNKPEDADGTVCARYCTAEDTHTNNTGSAAGQNDNCSNGSLQQAGGTNGANGAHQCRFVQNFYSNTTEVPVEVGMCVPVVPAGGGTWADCTLYDHDGLVAAYNAETTPEGQETAFNNFCLVTPADPMNSDITPECEGLFRGCISLAKELELVDVGGAIFNKEAWATRNGLDMKALNPAAAEKF